jgi:hypothetical protein
MQWHQTISSECDRCSAWPPRLKESLAADHIKAHGPPTLLQRKAPPGAGLGRELINSLGIGPMEKQRCLDRIVQQLAGEAVC